MSLTLEAQPLPLRLDESGTIRIANTRVTLDTLVNFYNQGYSPERLVEAFDSLALPDVYAAIGYYLRHKTDVDRYMAERRKRAEEFEKAHPEMFPTGVREKLLARKREMDSRGH